MQFQFDTQIAAEYSLEEAVFVHHIHYWVMTNEANGRNEFDGLYWTYNSADALAKIFAFWSPRQIRRIVDKCRDHGLILTRQLGENPRDRTLWYTVTETVKCIYRFGQMEKPERSNGCDQTVKCYKEQIVNTDSKPDREGERTHGEFKNVKLTHAEMDKLTDRWTDQQVQQQIEALSIYMKSSGKRYASHYATLLNWLKRDFPLDAPAQPSTTLIEEAWFNGSP